MATELGLLRAELKVAKAEMERMQDIVARKSQRTSEGHTTAAALTPGKRSLPEASSQDPRRLPPHHSLYNTAGAIKIPATHSRSFDFNASDGLVLLSHRGPHNDYNLEKVSIVANQRCRIQLHPQTGLVRDIQLAEDGRQAAVASLGTEVGLQVVHVANGTVVTRLRAPSSAWSCAWDKTCEHRVLCGLQDGRVAVFDLRRSDMVMAMHASVDHRHPVHTVKSCKQLGGCRMLSASIGGVHAWLPADGRLEDASSWDPTSLHAVRIVDGVGRGGQACMSLACEHERFATAVASFRAGRGGPPFHWVAKLVQGPVREPWDRNGVPDVQLVDRDLASQGANVPSWHGRLGSQQAGAADGRASGAGPEVWQAGPVQDPDQTVAGWGLWGRLMGHGYSSSATMSRAAIVCPHSCSSSNMPWFACADELTRQMWLWDLGSGEILERFPSHESHITCIRTSGFMQGSHNVEAIASLSDQSLQMFLPCT
mmetsp:Transcript_21478/g.59658  ORF Transcript_21478/g.59658 Transcript_21478/m.59658 type:complete len:482 (+) Transcript_21478:554-1999(+)